MTYQMINSSIVSKGAMNSFNEMFPLARMFPLAVMRREREVWIFYPPESVSSPEKEE